MPRRLNIGGEKPHPDWELFNIQHGEGVDHVGNAQDLSRFDDETFDEIYASHVLEHFDYNGPLQKALKEWHRVLKPGGKVYISVPDMEVLCRLFMSRSSSTPKESFQIMRMMFGAHTDQHDYHYTGLSPDILKHFLAEAGFTNAKRVKEFGIFKDTSILQYNGTYISLNVIVTK